MVRKNILPQHTARILFIIPGILLCLLFQNCTTKKAHNVVPAFYFWKTNLCLSPYEQSVLKGIQASTLYLRLFDVDWDNKQLKALPVGILQSDTISDTTLHYIPVVYITQACLLRLQEKDLKGLADNINSLITSLCRKANIKPGEIQIDCDWTKNSASRYFSLLRHLKSEPFFYNKQLSCTIRMHQVKFTTSSGIPPVDRGLLMVYNMGNLTRYGGHNSILGVPEAKNYLKHIRIYPLPLDIALPIYHWSVLFEHKRFKGIVYNISKDNFRKGCIEQKEDNLYTILKDTTSGGYSFKQGQEIRFEQPEQKNLEQMAAYISQNIKQTNYRVSFFHLDSFAMKQYTIENLNQILTTFR